MPGIYTFEGALTDSSGDGNDLTLTGIEKYVSGPEGDRALRKLNGESLARAAASCVDLDAVGDFTFAAKFFLSSFGTFDFARKVETVSSFRGWQFRVLSTGALRFRVSNGTNNGTQRDTAAGTVDSTAWYAIVCTVDHTALLQEIWSQGVKLDSYDITGLLTGDWVADSGDLTMAGAPVLSVAHMAIEQRVWTDAEIAAYTIPVADSNPELMGAGKPVLMTARAGVGRAGVIRAGATLKTKQMKSGGVYRYNRSFRQSPSNETPTSWTEEVS